MTISEESKAHILHVRCKEYTTVYTQLYLRITEQFNSIKFTFAGAAVMPSLRAYSCVVYNSPELSRTFYLPTSFRYIGTTPFFYTDVYIYILPYTLRHSNML